MLLHFDPLEGSSHQVDGIAVVLFAVLAAALDVPTERVQQRLLVVDQCMVRVGRYCTCLHVCKVGRSMCVWI